MQAERWQRVEELYHAAIAQPPEKRADFLTDACADASIRAEVIALLDQSTDSFLNSAPVSLTKALSPGFRLGHFDVVELMAAAAWGKSIARATHG